MQEVFAERIDNQNHRRAKVLFRVLRFTEWRGVLSDKVRTASGSDRVGLAINNISISWIAENASLQ
jgi:hypothetical protein